MSLRTSQVFAASRNAVQEESIAAIRADLVPAFNAEVIDIEKMHTETLNRFKNQALADNKRKARMLMLVHSRKAVLDVARLNFEASIDKLVEQLGGEKIIVKEIPKGEIAEREVRKVKFPDGSMARLPSFFIPYADFQQV